MIWLRNLQVPDLRGCLEILVLTVAFFYLIRLFRGTRATQVLTGLVVFLLTALFLTQVLQLETLTWILQRFFVYLAIAVLVIFQPEFRRGLAEIGRQPVFGVTARELGVVDAVVRAVLQLSERRIGALIAIQREIGTRAIQESGKWIDARVSAELLSALFFPRSPLHDGGVVIAGNRIAAAGCLFPLPQEGGAPQSLGTRHRAAIGMSEETDAIVVVVSEETGTISVAYKGGLSRGLDEERLRKVLLRVLHRKARKGSSGKSWIRNRLGRVRGAIAEAVPPGEDAIHG
jgi:diadenylate cyclase